MSMIYPVSGGDITGPVLSATGNGGGGHAICQGTSSGTIGGVCYSPTSEGPGSRISPTSAGPDGPSVFPPLPPPPLLPTGYGGLSTVDESEMQDGPEYEEEEVVFPLSAPPTNQWYHGKLDRTIAEERLRQAKTPGSYLIRESDRRPGSFVLSFLSLTSVVNHFRIIAMCGDYYIGGRRFSSLSDLIGYYSYVSCLLKGEKLLSPVAPPEPVEDRRRVRAILPYTKVPETDEISFLKGDMFIVHNELDDGWMWVTNVRTEEQGLIVEDLVEEVFSFPLHSPMVHPVFSWYHGKISKQEAYNLLMTVGQVCSFLVRPSDNTPGDYSLFFRTNENIQRFKICPTPNNQYMMGGRYYNSVDDIVDHYKKEQIVEGYNLKDAVSVQHQEQVLSDLVDGKEIYNTIRRKTKDAFYKNIVKKGYLLFNKGKGKRWKNLYFILEGNDAQLIYFESEKRATKPKGLIDLSVCSVYGVHDSLFGRPNCFQVVVQHFSEEQYIFYFAGETPEQAQVCTDPSLFVCLDVLSQSHLSVVSSLVLYVEEAHKLPVKHFTNPYCNIYLNNVQVAKTHPREGQNPVFTEEFIFDDLSSEINRFEISLSNKTKKSKESDILFMRCQLSRLQKGQMIDEWFPLSSHVPLKGIEPGSLRVRARYSMEKIMPEEEYSEFKELILLKEFHVIYALAHVCGQDRTLLASILLRIFRHEKTEAPLLRTLNDREINMEDEATTLFRATTLASTLMEQYMKATATPFVHHALKDTILKIMESKQSCELNPSKLEKNEDVHLNLAHLLLILSELVEKIFMAAEILPPTLRYIYGCLQKSVQQKWPNTTMRTRVVSGFVFLRLICPAILNPRMFNIITDPPSATAGRTLTLVAKSVQNLANLVEFGAKEPYMEGVNPFIKNNKHRMIMFLDELGNVPDLPEATEHFRTDLSRDLAALHEICVSHSDDLRTLSNERGAQQHVLKKLLAITELLQQKQDHYAMSNSNR
uniref:Ras GTPase-activating protein 1 n=1 Tax=Oncorhynchus tshawytscha TaxID=74940 RepID=A0A8C8FBM2_ONCTS